MTSKTTNKFSSEVRTQAVQMVLDHEGDHASRWAAVVSIAAKIGCTPQRINQALFFSSTGYCRRVARRMSRTVGALGSHSSRSSSSPCDDDEPQTLPYSMTSTCPDSLDGDIQVTLRNECPCHESGRTSIAMY
jgi:hypothetical protein